jgi:hypothetical protein
MLPRLTRRFIPVVLCALIGALFVVAPVGAAPPPKADLVQCANGPSGTDSCDWVNGNVGASKARYLEGDSLPARLVLSGLTPGSTTNTVTIEWDTTKGGKHAIDYLTTFNRTVAVADPCAGVVGCNSPTTFAIPQDSNVTTAGVTQIAGNFTMYNGTITAASPYTRSGTYAGDSSTRITLTFTAGSATPVLAWAGHISTRVDWGLNNSAVGISGSPYHTSLVELNGGGGNQDVSASAAAVVFPGSITIVKDAVPDAADDFAFSTTGPVTAPLTPATFSLDDDGTATPLSNTRTFTNITTFGSYTFTEAASSGWTLSFQSPACTVTSGNNGTSSANAGTRTVTVNLAEGENVTCTFVNTAVNTPEPLPASLTVIKTVVNDNGGRLGAADFIMNVDGTDVSRPSFPGDEAGTIVSLDAGTYDVTETLVDGYTPSYSAGCSGTLAAGATGTCTVTNDDQPASLTVIKNVVNDDDGKLAAAAFTMNVTGTDVSDPTFPGASGAGTPVTLDAGNYSVGEGPVTGYAGSFSAGCSGTIALGEARTCTITNDDVPDNRGHIVVQKVTLPTPSSQAFGFTADYDGDGFSLVNGQSNDSGLLVPDTYSVAETATAGWSLTGVICSDGSAPGSIHLDAGETVTCVFTNTQTIVAGDTVTPTGNGNPGTEIEAATQTQGNNPTPPLQSVPVQTPALPAVIPATASDPATSPAEELPRTGAGLREESLLALVLMLAGLSVRALGRRRNSPAAG